MLINLYQPSISSVINTSDNEMKIYITYIMHKDTNIKTETNVKIIHICGSNGLFPPTETDTDSQTDFCTMQVFPLVRSRRRIRTPFPMFTCPK